MMYQITIPGEVKVKKNSMKELWYRWETSPKTGLRNKIPLKKPIKFYTKQYKKWAKSALTAMANWKTAQQINFPNDKFPICTPIMVWYVFFMKSMSRVDLSNLVDGVDDMLAGNIGVEYKSTKKDAYQILFDDSADIIKVSHQSFFVDYMNPRLDVFITDYDLGKYSQAFKILYPGMAISTGLENTPQISIDFDTMFMGGGKSEQTTAKPI